MSNSLDASTEGRGITDPNIEFNNDLIQSKSTLLSYSHVTTQRKSNSFSNVTAWQKMLSACAGSVFTAFFMTPFDVVKTRLQVQSTPVSSLSKPFSPYVPLSYTIRSSRNYYNIDHQSIGNRIRTPFNGSAVLEEATPRQFKGTWDGMIKIVRFEGITSLWRGIFPALMMSGPSTVVHFVGYDYLKEYLTTRLGDNYTPLAAGALARTASATVISPLELIRTRMQSIGGKKGGMRIVMDGVLKMLRNDGITSLWRGLTTTLWRDIPFSALYWMGLEQIRARFLFYYTSSPSNPHPFIVLNDFEISFLSGAISGMFAATLTTPFDVAKTRRQVYQGKEKQKIVKILTQIAKDDGWRGLWKGLVPRIMKVAPSCAIMISSYEMGKKFFAGGDVRTLSTGNGVEAVGVEEI